MPFIRNKDSIEQGIIEHIIQAERKTLSNKSIKISDLPQRYVSQYTGGTCFLEAMFRIYVLIELCKTYFTCFNLTIIIINIAIQAPIS